MISSCLWYSWSRELEQFRWLRDNGLRRVPGLRLIADQQNRWLGCRRCRVRGFVEIKRLGRKWKECPWIHRSLAVGTATKIRSKVTVGKLPRGSSNYLSAHAACEQEHGDEHSSQGLVHAPNIRLSRGSNSGNCQVRTEDKFSIFTCEINSRSIFRTVKRKPFASTESPTCRRAPSLVSMKPPMVE